MIHGRGRPQYIREAPFGMPVAAQMPGAADQGAVPPQAAASLAVSNSAQPPDVTAQGARGAEHGAAETDDSRPGPAAAATDADEADDLRRELQSSLQKLQDTLLSLEAAPTDADLLHAAFRRLHAVKGHFTMLDAETTAALAHQEKTA